MVKVLFETKVANNRTFGHVTSAEIKNLLARLGQQLKPRLSGVFVCGIIKNYLVGSMEFVEMKAKIKIQPRVPAVMVAWSSVVKHISLFGGQMVATVRGMVAMCIYADTQV